MEFCVGVDDKLIISICYELNDKNIVKIYDILNKRLTDYQNKYELSKTSKQKDKIMIKINAIQKCKLDNQNKYNIYVNNVENNDIKTFKTKDNKLYVKKQDLNKKQEQNIRKEQNNMKQKIEKAESYIEHYFPRLNLLCNKSLNITDIKNIILKEYPLFDGFIKKIKNLKNKSLYNIIIFNETKKNINNQKLVNNILKTKNNEHYILNIDNNILYFEIDKRDINNNYDYIISDFEKNNKYFT